MLSSSALIFFSFLVILLIGCLLIFLPILFGAKGSHLEEKSQTYECGVDPIEKKNGNVAVRFHLVAILFILLDVEVVFMYPWAVAFKSSVQSGYGVYMFLAMAVFAFLFILGLFWEIKSKALDWEKM